MLLKNMQVIGVDEVGRGSWAGPLLVVAARLTGDLPTGLRDSKLLSKKQRNAIFQLLSSNFQFGEGWVQPEEIDAHGLSTAMRIGVNRALVALGAGLEDEIIIDGNINYCPSEFTNARCEVKADSLQPIVSAASIYAKVARDGYMARIAQFYPNYSFEKHVGYGTKLHRDLLIRYGVSGLHRKSYKPIQAFLEAAT
jgi:ribonuclease HII